MKYFLKVTLALLILTAFSCGKKVFVLTRTEKNYYHFSDSSNTVRDTEALELIRPYKLRLDSMVNEVISFSDTEMVKAAPEGLLGNFITDLVLKQSLLLYSQPVDFCVLNNGGFRAPLPKGAVSVRNVFELMPFENEAVILKLSGSTVKQLLDRLAQKGGDAVSGLRFTISDGRAEDIYINGSEFNINRTYIMVTSDYLANGGEDLFFLKDALQNQPTGVKLRDLIIGFLRLEKSRGATINSALDGRIKFK